MCPTWQGDHSNAVFNAEWRTARDALKKAKGTAQVDGPEVDVLDCALEDPTDHQADPRGRAEQNARRQAIKERRRKESAQPSPSPPPPLPPHALPAAAHNAALGMPAQLPHVKVEGGAPSGPTEPYHVGKSNRAHWQVNHHRHARFC